MPKIRGTRTRVSDTCRVHTIYINILRTKFYVCVWEPDEEFCKFSWLDTKWYETINWLEWTYNWYGFIWIREKDIGTLLHELYHLFQDMSVFEWNEEREFAAYLYEDIANRLILLEWFKPSKKVLNFYTIANDWHN